MDLPFGSNLIVLYTLHITLSSKLELSEMSADFGAAARLPHNNSQDSHLVFCAYSNATATGSFAAKNVERSPRRESPHCCWYTYNTSFFESFEHSGQKKQTQTHTPRPLDLAYTHKHLHNKTGSKHTQRSSGKIVLPTINWHTATTFHSTWQIA